MSVGFTGLCKLVAEDDSLVIYSYAGENWNDGGRSKAGDASLQDGMFSIEKSCVTEDIGSGLGSGAITIDKECKNAFRRRGAPCDYIAWCLLLHVIDHYKKNGNYPKEESFIQ